MLKIARVICCAKTMNTECEIKTKYFIICYTFIENSGRCLSRGSRGRVFILSNNSVLFLQLLLLRHCNRLV